MQRWHEQNTVPKVPLHYCMIGHAYNDSMAQNYTNFLRDMWYVLLNKAYKHSINMFLHNVRVQSANAMSEKYAKVWQHCNMTVVK